MDYIMNRHNPEIGPIVTADPDEVRGRQRVSPSKPKMQEHIMDHGLSHFSRQGTDAIARAIPNDGILGQEKASIILQPIFTGFVTNMSVIRLYVGPLTDGYLGNHCRPPLSVVLDCCEFSRHGEGSRTTVDRKTTGALVRLALQCSPRKSLMNLGLTLLAT